MTLSYYCLKSNIMAFSFPYGWKLFLSTCAGMDRLAAIYIYIYIYLQLAPQNIPLIHSIYVDVSYHNKVLLVEGIKMFEISSGSCVSMVNQNSGYAFVDTSFLWNFCHNVGHLFLYTACLKRYVRENIPWLGLGIRSLKPAAVQFILECLQRSSRQSGYFLLDIHIHRSSKEWLIICKSESCYSSHTKFIVIQCMYSWHHRY